MNLDFGSVTGLVAAPFTGGASLALTGLSSAASFLGDKYGMEKQQAFEREMSGSAHQREVADLRAAGLNPILSATGGPGASYHGVSAPDFGSGVVSSALGGRRLMEELNNIRQDTKKKLAETMLTKRLENTAMVDVQKRDLEVKNLRIEGDMLKQELQTRGSAAAAARVEEEIDESTLGRVLRWINRISSSIQGAGGSAEAVRRGAGVPSETIHRRGGYRP